MVSYLAQTVEDIIRSFTSTFTLGEKLKIMSTFLGLSKLNFINSSCQKLASDITLSTPIKIEISHLRAVTKVTDTKILKLKFVVKLFLSVFCAYLAEKPAIKYYPAKNATYLLVKAPEISGRRFSRQLETLVTAQELSEKIVEQAKIEFTKFLQHVFSTHKEKFLEFDMTFYVF